MCSPYQGHTGSVTSVAFSPDGTYIVSGSNDKTIRVWSKQGQVGSPFQGHTHSVNSVAFSPDGGHIVSGSKDKTIRIWDAQSGFQVCNSLQGHTNSVNSVAFSSDGLKIVSGSDDMTVRVWNAQVHYHPNYDDVQNMKFLPVNFSPSRTHTLQQPQSLFKVDSSSNCVETDFPLWVYPQNDGWIVGPNKELLLWVPPSHHPIVLYSPRTNLVIPRGVTELDLSKMKHGPAWEECYFNTILAT